MPSFLEALTLTSDGEAVVTADWAQGRAVFGGLVAALAVRAVRPGIEAGRRLRSVLVDFVSPAEVGPIRVTTTLHRAGRAFTHAEARVLQGDELRALVVLAYAVDRATAIRVPATRPAEVPRPEALPPMPFADGVPAFTRHFEYRWAEGDMPFTGADAPLLGGWVRFAEHAAAADAAAADAPASDAAAAGSAADAAATDAAAADAPADDAHVLALLDAWPAPVLPLLRGVAPASTVTWMVDFVGPVAAPPGAWWRFSADTVAAGDGHASVHGRLWGQDGGLVAVSRQMVAEFSKG